MAFPFCHLRTFPASRYRQAAPRTILWWGAVLLFGSGGNVLAENGGKSLIWRLDGENATVFLAGSVHLLREKDLPVPAAYDTVYDACDEVVFEIDMASLLSPVTSRTIREIGSLPAGEKLESRLGADLMSDLRTHLARRLVSTSAFDSFTPGMAYLTLGSLEAARHGANPELGLESRYYRRALQDKKDTRGLETVAYQMERLRELDEKTVAKLIREILEEADASEKALEEILVAWRSGEVKQIESLVVNKMAKTPALKKALLTDRNEKWIKDIEEALAGDRRVLFLVGAAHLAGEGSVVDLLERRGHRLVQMGAAHREP